MATSTANEIPSHLGFPVVGIGASAGGIDSLKTLFEALPGRTGAAYVIVLHLAPEYTSQLHELLQAVTSMPVMQVTSATAIEVDHVYVIAPSLQLTMVDGYLRVQPDTARNGVRTAIDRFFRSLAQMHRERAVAVVLSGAGADGSVGITRVKEMGGLAIAQDPDEAEYDSMPRAAIATGMVDFVCRLNEIPQRLLDLWSRSRTIQMPSMTDDEAADGSTRNLGEEASAERALREIMVMLRTRTSHDFRRYKRATMLRRIERRLQVNDLNTLNEYRDFLHTHPDETQALLQDMLISVTNFFRDPEAFAELRSSVLPRICGNRDPAEPVRVWSAGCATGEEAYTLAMLLSEESAHAPEGLPFQVFATDIDERAISLARSGLYPESILTDVDPGRMRQFFTKDAAHYRVKKELRERVLFALHNVLSDPPFSRLDLICCRNLLIYLDRDAQIEILRTFHFALRPGGYLFLGSSEAVDAVSTLFTVVDKKARIFRANVAVRADAQFALSTGGVMAMRPTVIALPPEGKRKFSFGDLHQRLVEQYAPPSALVSRESEIVHLSDRAGRFLQYAGGEPSHNIIAVVRPELRLELRTAIYQALHSNHSVEARRVRLERDGRAFFVSMIARPVHDMESNADFVLVLFDEVEDSMSATSTGIEPDRRDPVIAQLERELQRTKEQLQATIEQSETSTEELKASNEELQAINEELRSATEELETSKEELQSINEELTTVNAELKAKVEETGKINDDLRNLITANDIGTIFVDRNIRIKRYTPRATEVFSIIPSDIGRSLLDITHRLEYDKLADDAAEAFDSLRLIERELRSSDGRWYLARFLPYRTTEDRIEGAVLSFVDITTRKEAEQRLHEGEKRMKIVAESTRDYAIITFGDDGRVTSWNVGAERLFGYPESEMLGRPSAQLYTQEDRDRDAAAVEMAAAREHGQIDDDRLHVRKDGTTFRMVGVLSRLDKGGVSGYAKIGRAFDELPAGARMSASGAERRRDEFLAVVSHELKHPLNLIGASAELIDRAPEARDSDLIRRATSTIRRTVLGQAQIIDDLLDMSRLRTGKLAMQGRAIDFADTVRRVSEAVQRDARRDGIQLAVELPDTPVVIHADLTRIEQIVWNLVSNAMKFVRPSGRVTIALQRDGDTAELRVSDDGAGIAGDLLPHVFDMFRQAEPMHGAKRRGLGIGLSLVRELTVLHGGEVEAQSDGVDRGATFVVRLPCLNDPKALEAAQGGTASLIAGEDILLVDDDAETVETFRALLEMEGAHVLVANSGEAALAILDGRLPSVILSDLGMPGMSGIEFIRAVRARAELADIDAIALSSYGRADDMREASEAGFDAHLSKPVMIDALLNAIAQLRNGKNGRR